VKDALDRKNNKDCPACGRMMRLLTRTESALSRTVVAYFKCEECGHSVIVYD
jgi:predicted RNA-binding Zn-ribbon protein involved in translation (DUF1610 family)